MRWEYAPISFIRKNVVKLSPLAPATFSAFTRLTIYPPSEKSGSNLYCAKHFCADTVKQALLMSAIGMHRQPPFNRPSFRRLKANARLVPKIRQRVRVLESPSRVHEKGRSA